MWLLPVFGIFFIIFLTGKIVVCFYSIVFIDLKFVLVNWFYH